MPPLSPRVGTTRSFATLRAVSALMLREMATRYGRSPGGYLWALLEPLGGIMVMALGFSLLLRSPPLGNSFMLFYATGFLPFSLYQGIARFVGGSIEFSKPLLQYPAVTWVDAAIARFLLNALTGILIALLLISGIMIVSETRALVELPPIVTAMSLALLIGLSIGVLNCALFGLFPVWTQVWGIFTRPLFLASGVLILYDDLPTSVQNILWYNPLMHVTGLMRSGFYPSYRADYVDLTYCLATGLIPLFLGVVLMSRYHREILANK
ncbi:ABC transporter permease [Salipiger bermudensis]|uniref:ABC transporter permease n=1 Tax=Salipiger bermudensis TaxID=344736 RepID=UPI001C9954A6|nr:ABC transporter permease [Salipiger bermudensis]MBY6006624.1 ABC transporter permease [Salipiger bermudensis]